MADEQPGNMPNAPAIGKVHHILDELLVDALRRGWYGEIVLTIPIQDGSIQVDGVEGVGKRRRRISKR